MSRVDDAMRRVTGAAAEDLMRTPVDASPAEEMDPVVLAGEPFPGEESAAGQSDAAPLNVMLPAMGPAAPLDEDHAAADSAQRRLLEKFDARLAEKLVIDPRMPHTVREQYRRLAAVLHDAQTTRKLQVVMIASAMAGEGKTLTAANLALTLSSSYRRRVMLIDADLRRPMLHHVFRIDTPFGLSDGLDPSVDTKLIVRQILPNLAVLPAGRPNPDPMASLISTRMERLLAEARETFDWVIIDTPPLVLLPDANLLASMVDGAVLVVRADSTPHHLVKRASEAIGKSHLLGVVLNRSSVGPHGADSDYYDHYATQSTAVVSS